MSRQCETRSYVTYVLIWTYGTYICKSLTLTTFPKVPSPRVASTLSVMQKWRWMPSKYEPRGPRREGVLACVHWLDEVPFRSWLWQKSLWVSLVHHPFTQRRKKATLSRRESCRVWKRKKKKKNEESLKERERDSSMWAFGRSCVIVHARFMVNGITNKHGTVSYSLNGIDRKYCCSPKGPKNGSSSH